MDFEQAHQTFLEQHLNLRSEAPLFLLEQPDGRMEL
jgi:hypothetical protein